MTVADTFSMIENNKKSLGIESYILSQTSLEQIFLSIANKFNDLKSKLSFTNANFDDFEPMEILIDDQNKKKSKSKDLEEFKF